MTYPSFWRDFAAVRIYVTLPDGRELAIQEALSQTDLEQLSLLIGPPPLPDLGPSAIFDWQKKNEDCMAACKALGFKIARALQLGFRDNRWSPR